MSGGVDSSVVAAMLAQQGFDVVGVTLQLYDHGAALALLKAWNTGHPGGLSTIHANSADDVLRRVEDLHRVLTTVNAKALAAGALKESR